MTPNSRPILFSAPMVRALLAGTKTQTRRIVKVPGVGYIAGAGGDRNDPANWGYEDDNGDWATLGKNGDMHSDYLIRCPYGEPGDHLWVRETFTEFIDHHVIGGQRWAYAANCTDSDGERIRQDYIKAGYPYRWKPSIHMPRAASRITLEITGVRVERLQVINHVDAEAEGIPRAKVGFALPDCGADPQTVYASPVGAYQTLWNNINGPGSWDANPFVWVVEFKRVLP